MAEASASLSAVAQPAAPSFAERMVHAATSRLVVVIPYLWLLLFFLIPFIIVFRISLSQTAIAMPPYTPGFTLQDGLAAFFDQLRELNFDNYVWLTEDPLYFNAYVSSVWIAAVSTFFALLVGYPIAY